MKRSSVIWIDTNGNVLKAAIYTQEPKEALVYFLEQQLKGNFNTSEYEKSKFIPEIKQTMHGYVYDIVSDDSLIYSTIKKTS